MVMWARSAVRSVLTTALRMPKKAAAPAAAKKEKVARIIEVVKENTKTGDPMTGINYLKAGKDPILKEDSEYPEWLLKLTEPMATMRELDTKLETLGKNGTAYDELRRLVQLTNRARIKEHNSKNAKE